ncbi:hypothetical protein NM688_g4236 [Phlebia brevispora]|uniref:Uncharacterized protein n=1 Tax=Phlebia brevispora TaxID=194682 RepID=A0ACC1T3M5_9APHY|nr:hypothetical protein NM688_g4236 [Phlebia brevispora]
MLRSSASRLSLRFAAKPAVDFSSVRPESASVQLPSSTTYYDVLNVPYDGSAFDVDLVRLKKSFRDLQRIIHPDKWSGKGDTAQETAAEMSGIVNRAYGILTNPYTRAEYILQLEGVPIEEQDNIEDPSLIMEVMETREELDGAEDRTQVEQIRLDNLSKINDLLPRLSAAVADKDWGAVKEATIRLKYLQGIDQAAQAWPNQPFDH